MAFELRVNSRRWLDHVREIVDSNRGIVPIIKGNGYGFGRDFLIAETRGLDLRLLGVGTYDEAREALRSFDGDVLVLSPWRSFIHNLVYDDRIIHTLGRVEDIRTLAQTAPGSRIVIEGETSMARHGLDRHAIAAAVSELGDLVVEGFALHLPMAGNNLAEAEQWCAALETSQLETTTVFISHLLPDEVEQLRRRRPNLEIRPRVGTRLWLGDLEALSVQATVLDLHRVEFGERIGYRQRPMPRDGWLLIVEGGTSHGVGLEAPRAVAGVRQRGKSLAKGGLAAAGLSMSPFTIAGKQRWFAEPPHMQASMIFLPEGTEPPEVGDTVKVAVRFTTTTFDRVLRI